VIDEQDLALALPRAPEWTWGGSIDWSAPLGDSGAMLFANAFFQHRAKYAYTDNNWGFNSPSDRLDAGIGVNLGNPAIRLTLFGRNLLDELQFGGDTQLPFAGGGQSDGTNEPFDPNPAAGTFSPRSRAGPSASKYRWIFERSAKMVTITVAYKGDLHCEAVHGPSSTTLATDAEQRAADADMRRAEHDRGLEIAAHPHRQPARPLSVGDLGQQREIGRRLDGERRHAHQPDHRDPRAARLVPAARAHR
jgi:hypothetical protein